MKSALAKPFSLGIDTVTPIVDDMLKAVLQHKFAFVVRYITGRYAITPPELDLILQHGLGWMPVTHSRAPGWMPSAAIGTKDGASAIEALRDLGAPKCTVWLDLEGVGDDPTDYVRAWSRAVCHAGYEAGLYVGAQCGLDATELWMLPQITRYWRSGSAVPTPSNRGWCMQQLRPLNYSLGAIKVDVNVVEHDHRGGLPLMVRA